MDGSRLAHRIFLPCEARLHPIVHEVAVLYEPGLPAKRLNCPLAGDQIESNLGKPVRIRRARLRCSCHWSSAVSVPEPSTNFDKGKLEVTGILLHPDIESGSEGVSDVGGFLALDQDVASSSDVLAGHARFQATANRHHILDLKNPLRDLSDVLRHKLDSGGCICRRLGRLFTGYLVMIGTVSGTVSGTVGGTVGGFFVEVYVLILQVIQPRYDSSVLGSFCADCLLTTQRVKAVSDRLAIHAVTL
jgi:hypothetical protein